MEEKKEISLEIRPEVAKGTYSNLAIITHSHSEFIIDFATILPGLPKPDISNRIVMTPEHAKRLLNALMDNVTNTNHSSDSSTLAADRLSRVARSISETFLSSVLTEPNHNLK